MYCKVENDKVVGVFQSLPKTQNNISGFDTLPEDALVTYGFYGLTEVKPELAFIDIGEPSVGEDAAQPVKVYTQTYGTTTDTIEGSVVTRTYSVAAKDSANLNDEISAIFTKSLEALYDTKAKERRYDSRFTCALRAGYVSPFQQEGLTFATWMDECNAYAYQVMSEVLSGNRQIPTINELLSELPELTWPV